MDSCEGPGTLFIKEGHPNFKELAAAGLSAGRVVYIEYKCRNCLGRGWFGRAEAPWAKRHCGDCAGIGWTTRRYTCDAGSEHG